jgi:hypothetical protein
MINSLLDLSKAEQLVLFSPLLLLLLRVLPPLLLLSCCTYR